MVQLVEPPALAVLELQLLLVLVVVDRLVSLASLKRLCQLGAQVAVLYDALYMLTGSQLVLRLRGGLLQVRLEAFDLGGLVELERVAEG